MSDLASVLSDHVPALVPGAVAAVWRCGEEEVVAVGDARPDSLFRVTSMTKPVMAAAALSLVADGTLALDAPIDRWLPELADRRVLVRPSGPLDETVPSPRPITVEDVLTFRLGLGMPPAPLDAYPVQRAEAALGTRALGPPMPATELDLDTWLARLGILPLLAPPGERWLYSAGSHVLGALLARATGRPLAEVVRERVLDPVGMVDTGFVVGSDDLHRLGPQLDAEGAVVDPADGQWARPRSLDDAAAGLVSTASDYLRFGRMLLGRGTIDGVRVLPEAQVDAMLTDHLTPAQATDGAWLLDGRGWGYGLAVRAPGARPPGTPGGAGWDGGFGTTWAVDPERDLVGVCLTARLDGPELSPVHRAFWAWAYGD